jgi:hypothetical protein
MAKGAAHAPPKRKQGPYSWELCEIRRARDHQLRGEFALPVRMAEAFRTDDALFTAYQARVSTQSAIRLAWRPANTPNGPAVAKRAESLISVPQHVRESILGTLANHGIAIGYVLQETVDTPEGPSLRMTLTEWPLEHVRYDVNDGSLKTQTLRDGQVTITHGDGRWIVFAKFGALPWTQDACVLPAALIWAAHAEGLSDWAGASYTHGRAKILGELPEAIPLGDGAGGLTPDASTFLELLTDVVAGDAAAGIIPFGAKATYLANNSTAWQVFHELIVNREGAAARVYLGTDAILGSRGGAPGVDVAALFGIATTRIQGDLEALERGFREGMLWPWRDLHGVAAEDMPCLAYQLPDVDADKKSEQEAAAIERLAASIKALKDSGLDVTQDVIDSLSRVLGVSVPTNLAQAETKIVPLPLAPTDVARVIKVREARASQGLPPLGDERDDLFVSELEALFQAKVAAEQAAAQAEAAPAPEGEEPEAEAGDAEAAE